MAKVENKKTNQIIILFGQEVEQRELSNQEVIDLVKAKFEGQKYEVGKMSYFLLALKHLGMTKLSYASNTLIIKKLFETQGLVTDTTEKCQAWYMQRIKKNKIDITKDFSESGRKKEIINVSELVF